MQFSRILSGTLLIAGTTVGAGMLGIPLVTGGAGFIPATLVTVAVWFFMLCTGLLFLEVALWMPAGSNILSMASRFLGWKGKWVAGATFIFLYYCLMVAYFAAGAPLFASFFHVEGVASFLVFGLVFGTIVALGAKTIDRTNIVLTVAMAAAYVALIGTGSAEVQLQKLTFQNWKPVLFAMPVLFSAFGFHNVIPSLADYLKRDKKSLQLSIVLGTSIPLVIYLLWQWLVMGILSQDEIAKTLAEGKTAAAALVSVIQSSWLIGLVQAFAFFAIVTSMLGVAFSMVDFLKDGFKTNRVVLTVFTFVPPLVLAATHPAIFDKALGIAGGFGEAFLNGLLPVALVWIGRYKQNLPTEMTLVGNKKSLILLFCGALFVMGLEIFQLWMG